MRNIKITKEKNPNSVGRFTIIRNVWPIPYREPYAEFHLLFDVPESRNQYRKIQTNKKRIVTYCSQEVFKMAENDGCKDVTEFAEKHKNGFEGYFELINN